MPQPTPFLGARFQAGKAAASGVRIHPAIYVRPALMAAER